MGKCSARSGKISLPSLPRFNLWHDLVVRECIIAILVCYVEEIYFSTPLVSTLMISLQKPSFAHRWFPTPFVGYVLHSVSVLVPIGLSRNSYSTLLNRIPRLHSLLL